MIRSIGIDPGMTGAIAVIDSDTPEHTEVWDMPALKMTSKVRRAGKDKIKTTNKVDPVGLHDLLKKITLEDDCQFFLEQVNAMPGQGVVSTFNFGMGYGVIQGVIGSLGHSPTLVHPTKWKKRFSLTGQDKDAARLMVLELFPYEADRFKRKKDGGRADAVLLAKYGLSELS